MDPLRVALRTYTLSLSLSLFPAVIPALASPKARSSKRIREILSRELSPTGFAFAMTLAIAGGRALDQLWTTIDPPKADKLDSKAKHAWHQMSAFQRTFLANTLSSSIAVMLLTLRRRRQHIPTAPIPLTIPAPPQRGSPTLDLTLLLLVRALDAQVQSFFHRSIHHRQNNCGSWSQTAEGRRVIQKLSTELDAFVFWLACSRFPFCNVSNIFHLLLIQNNVVLLLPTRTSSPELCKMVGQPLIMRLLLKHPLRITSLADMDPRLLVVLRAIRDGSWKYGRPSPTHGMTLTSMASDLNLNPLMGDPSHLPAHGGAEANQAWASFNFNRRRGVGGIPCELVHYNISGDSCTGNTLLRGARAFGQALLIYAPVGYAIYPIQT